MALLLCGAPLQAAETTPQQQKMTVCNQQASAQALTGEARKSWMSQCLKKRAPEEKGLTPQQMRMKTCNVQATEQMLTGDARKTFMSACLKNNGQAPANG
ncbi:PsiF family protein [Pantoea sp. 1.19]|uniref:PsiF family protein n=1 Tax=Pantoea sp. 1.19 TaxID=1925589 RepID=UPI001F0B06FD|nr:PsiF family protein [Pantoea sp. 1.19]